MNSTPPTSRAGVILVFRKDEHGRILKVRGLHGAIARLQRAVAEG
jgi:hypothetical protein